MTRRGSQRLTKKVVHRVYNGYVKFYNDCTFHNVSRYRLGCGEVTYGGGAVSVIVATGLKGDAV